MKKQGTKVKSATTFIMMPKNDFCFKELMADENIRKGFIASIEGVKPEDIEKTTLIDPITPRQYEDEKYGILDVLVQFRDGRKLNMEMQVLQYPNWQNRSIFYTSSMINAQLKQGSSYGDLKKCTHVGILDFTLFTDNQEFYSCFHLREDKRGFLYSDLLEFHILELPKLNDYENPKNELSNWARFFNATKKEEFEMLAEKDDYLKDAYEKLQNLSADDQKRAEYERRQKVLRDEISLIKDTKRLAAEEAREEERRNTEREKQRADAAEQEIEMLRRKIKELEMHQ